MTRAENAHKAPRTRIVDALIALVLWAASTLSLLVFADGGFSLRAIVIVGGLSALLTLPVAFRRSHTVASSALVAALFLVQAAIGFPLLPANVSLLIVVHALAYYAPRRASLGGLGLAYLGVVIAFFRYDSLLFVNEMNTLMRAMVWLLTAALISAAWLLGNVQRSRAALVRELTERARRLEYEQQQERALAAAEERARIAREMHDIVAHSLSVIVTQADGARYAAASQPEIAPQTLGTIAATARESLQEMRRLLGVLRQDEVMAMGPAPDLATLDSLVAELAASGLSVSLTKGSARSAPHRLPKGAELAVYRVVQEALTNVLKHAGPGVTAEVSLGWEPGGLLIAIIDDGRGAGADPTPEGGGHGIRGMQERVALYGGSVVAQPRLGGGFAVHAWVPFEER